MKNPFPADCAQRFEPGKLLASGGYGSVWSARQIDLDRPAAIKLLHAVESADQRARFEREARVTAALEHPNVVRVFDHGTSGGTPWIAFELVEGKSLRDKLKAGSLSLEQAVTVCAQVADALAKAHASGVLHRDVKPENVLDAGDGVYKVADFGIATFAGPENSIHTASGVVLGTPSYVSPEQLRGREAEPRSDVYALGCMLYELAVGQLPFPIDDYLRLLEAHLRTQPQPPSAIVAGLPPELDTFILRLLSKSPADRPEAQEVHAELTRMLESGTLRRVAGSGRFKRNTTTTRMSGRISRAPTSMTASIAPPPRSFPRTAALVAVPMLALALGLGAWFAREPRRPSPSPSGGTWESSAAGASPTTSMPLASYWGAALTPIARDFEALQNEQTILHDKYVSAINGLLESGAALEIIDMTSTATKRDRDAGIADCTEYLAQQRALMAKLEDLYTRVRATVPDESVGAPLEFRSYVSARVFVHWRHVAWMDAVLDRAISPRPTSSNEFASLTEGPPYRDLKVGIAHLDTALRDALPAILAVPPAPAPLPPSTLRFLSRVQWISASTGLALRNASGNHELSRPLGPIFRSLDHAEKQGHWTAKLVRDFFRLECGTLTEAGPPLAMQPRGADALRASIRDRLVALRGRCSGEDAYLEKLIKSYEKRKEPKESKEAKESKEP